MIANAKRAEQEKFTVEQQGQANAAAAKWEQEVIKATEVTKAEQQLAVQRLATERAELYKQQQILEGQGDAEKKKLVMAANGALEQKLDAWLAERKYAWEAFSKFQGNLVPTYSMGGSGGGTTNAVDWMQIMGINAMKQLNLDMNQKQK